MGGLKQQASLETLSDAERTMFSMMTPPPREVKSQFGVSRATWAGEVIVNAHPVMEMVFAAPAGARRLSARCGIVDSAYLNTDKPTDGVLFECLVRGPDGSENVLVRVFLDPAGNPRDRGIHQIDVDLPASAAGDVVLRTQPGPNGDLNRDWAFWGKVVIE